MPWSTPTLREVRSLVRDNIRGSLPGADASVPNSVLRVMSDAQGGLCHLVLQYEWLDRHGDIWLTNADGTTGRKVATLAQGTLNFTGIAGTVIPMGTRLQASNGVGYETTADITINADPPAVTAGPVRALDPGVVGNQPVGTSIGIVSTVPFVTTSATVVELYGGTDEETDDQLRLRVLQRIRQPPMGGAKHDYERWALAVPGVTRAWCGPLEMGMGTVTVRFMMDDLRADNGGFPYDIDVLTVNAYLDTVRPVAVKDYWAVAPIPKRVDVYINDLIPDTEAVRGSIEASLQEMLRQSGQPGQTVYAAWKYHAIMDTPGVESFRLRVNEDDVMPSPGHLPVLGDIVYGA
jgi:uncharacterized phage protein gp47/JayE